MVEESLILNYTDSYSFVTWLHIDWQNQIYFLVNVLWLFLSVLAEDAIKAALADYRLKQQEKKEESV